MIKIEKQMKSVVTKDMGYLSSVTDARIFLEKLYKKDS